MQLNLLSLFVKLNSAI